MAPFVEVESNTWGKTVRETRLDRGERVSFQGAFPAGRTGVFKMVYTPIVEIEILDDNKAKVRRQTKDPRKVEMGNGQTWFDRVFGKREQVKTNTKIVKRQSIFVSGQRGDTVRRIEWRDR